MCVLPAAARAECISMSGLSPGETLRNTLRINVSPKMSEVLLCSAPTTIDGPPGGDALDPQAGAVLVVQRVVQPAGAAGSVVLVADEGVRQVLRLGRVGRERLLVGLGAPVVVGDLDEVDADPRRVRTRCAQLSDRPHVGDGPGAALAGEPALVGEVTC